MDGIKLENKNELEKYSEETEKFNSTQYQLVSTITFINEYGKRSVESYRIANILFTNSFVVGKKYYTGRKGWYFVRRTCEPTFSSGYEFSRKRKKVNAASFG